MNTGILVPTLNAGSQWKDFLEGVEKQNVKVTRKVILDSGSKDDTVKLAKEYGFEVFTIDKKDFDHGYARQLLADKLPDVDVYIYMTQDCVLAQENSISNLLNAFNDEKVGIAYGRQLPRKEAGLLESHARLFNYPAISRVKSFEDKDTMGIKTASCSNSFAAYRKEALLQAGGFPKNSIFGEDVIVGGQILINGWKIAYVADAEGYHSHDYSIKEEFKRYFDIGVFHKTNYWLIDNFGQATGEGVKYIKSELQLLLKKNPLLLPKMVGSTFAKWFGYKLGMNYQKLSHNRRRSFSMHRSYWDKQKA
ncbi:glycosyltransferase [Mucilaginibacter sp. CAU 1740]|uniref:glycosyltransferase n=1 Tax=Mucilaginibacter sp. CAU 1740 TaxID=3140365 RepID=UPI00325B74D5